MFKSPASVYRKYIFAAVLCLPATLWSQQNVLTNQICVLDSILNIPINSASRYWQKASDAPASVTIISSDEIEGYGYETLAEVLQFVSGMYISYDRNYNYIGVRGFSRPTDYNDRIILMLNGHRINENVYGSCFVGSDLSLNLESVDQIEIVRGPGSSLYGTGAMFAVINIITKHGESGNRVRADVEAGSFGNRQVKASYLGTIDDVALNISGTWGNTDGQDLYYKEYDSPETNHGVAHNLDWEKYSGLLATAKYGALSFQTMFSSRSKGIPTGAYGVAFNDHATYSLDETFSAGVEYETDIDENKNLTIRSSFLHYFYQGDYPYDSLFTSDHVLGEQLTVSGQLLWDISSIYRAIVGCEVFYNPKASYFNEGDIVYFDKNVPFAIFSAYIHNEYQITDYLKAIAGLRLDSYSETGAYLAPRLAAVFTPWNTTTLKVLYGGAFRVPNFAESYYEDSNSGYKRSDNLRPERIKTIECIAEQRLADEYYSTVSLYHYTMSDLIDTQLDPVDSLFHYKNVSSVVANGVEVGVQARYTSGISAFASYSYQHTVDRTSDAFLTNSPENLLKGGMTVPVVDGISTSTEWLYESTRRTVYGTTTSPYFLGNVLLNLRLPVDGLSCSVSVRNVLNRRYSLPGGVEHIQDAIQQDGRSFRFHLHYTFR